MEDTDRRWRLILGGGEADGVKATLGEDDLRLDRALSELYEADRTGGLGQSAPAVARWLEEIRELFPRSVVSVLQKDAIERLDLHALLAEPEVLDGMEADIHLVTTLLTLAKALPSRARAGARVVVKRLVDDLRKRLTGPTVQAVRSGLRMGSRTRRPRGGDIDWHRTIQANLHNWVPREQRLVAERLVGQERRASGMRDLILLVDQSGSMAASIVYAGIFGSVLAGIPALRTRMFLFDTTVADVTPLLGDPVELFFGVALGGGTDIGNALSHASRSIGRPRETVVVLVSDLYEGGDAKNTVALAKSLVQSGVRMVTLLALSDEGAPAWDTRNAEALVSVGVPCFACTPDRFPEVMAGMLSGRSVAG